MYRFLSGLLIGASVVSAHGESADYAFVPPAGKALSSPAGPLAPSALARHLDDTFPRFSIDTYAGQNKALKQATSKSELQVGVGVDLDWTDTPLFGQPLQQDGRYHWRSSIQSVDAVALRMKVDMTALRPGDSLWVVDTIGNQPFGPYQFSDVDASGRWLPTTMGDSAVLWVSSEYSTPPVLTVLMLSHFFDSPIVKQDLPCPIPADCATGTALQEVTTGIGKLNVSHENGASFACSGALINNGNTEALEAYFLTANHCFNGSSSTLLASSLEVLWDFRANGCNSPDPNIEVISQLPRSSGIAFLATSSAIDGALIKLANVPVGTRGRAWLGWDTRAPIVNEGVVGFHHPQGTPMKGSFGVVTRIGVNSNLGQNQTTLSWSEGLTEGGSSGSPSMFNDGNFRIFGMLSNGNRQSCSGFGQRLDQYSSFRNFFDQIRGFLVDEAAPGSGRVVYREGSDSGGGGLTGCVLSSEKSVEVAGDLLVAGLALMTLLAMSASSRKAS